MKLYALNVSCLVPGKDVADVMLDFIDWLMAQEFGRRCILSVRDILSWVHFQNLMTEAGGMERMDGGAVEGCALRLDPVSAFVHAACLVYIDGIGSGKSNYVFCFGLVWNFLSV